jgi:hypothetical protein
MATLRKFVPRKPPKKHPLSLDRVLLASIVGLGGYGATQSVTLTMAYRDTIAPALAMVRNAPTASVAAEQILSDYTPIGTIKSTFGTVEKAIDSVQNPNTPPPSAPPELRLRR